MYHHFNETSLKGMTLVLEAAQGKREDIPLALVPLVMICTWITHLFGGSAGREGVAVRLEQHCLIGLHADLSSLITEKFC